MSTSDASAGRPFSDPDRFYQALVHAHEGLDVEQCLLLNARLILLLVQRLGNEDEAHALLREAVRGIVAKPVPGSSS